MKKIVFVLIMSLISSLLLLGCTSLTENDTNSNLIRYETYDEIVAAFSAAQQRGNVFGEILRTDMVATTAVAESSNDAKSGSTNYSETNVQVEGVDEADVVKTDGEYIYLLSTSKRTLTILKAYPIENSEIVSTLNLGEFYPQEMFVRENKILLFGSSPFEYVNNEKQQGGSSSSSIGSQGEVSNVIADRMMIDCFDCYYPYYSSEFTARLYDISNLENITLVKEIQQEGSYLSSRLVNDYAYFIINSYPRWYPYYGYYDYYPATKESADLDNDKNKSMLPRSKIDGGDALELNPNEVAFIPDVAPENFITIYSINIKNSELKKETIAANGQNIYASTENLYIASTNWQASEASDLKEAETAIEIATRPVVGMIAPLFLPGKESTVITKFGIENGNINFKSKGSVDGRILNQFSMDEYNNHFRIATTTGQMWGSGENQSKNNVYILNDKLELQGSIQGIAPGERIYSARFIGEKGYMVTFRQIDPFFVIDLSDPKNPSILGELKIPGYSDYLHPLDDNHIIGIGKDTMEAEKDDFVWFLGLKMAIFDVTDVSNPKELHKIVIGDRGTDSEALYNHKAFLFDREKNLLVIPITLYEISEEEKNDPRNSFRFPGYGYSVFQGAFVFDISKENGISERGRITHITSEEEMKRGYYYDYESIVNRALFIDNILYTLSNSRIKANDLTTIEELKVFELGK